MPKFIPYNVQKNKTGFEFVQLLDKTMKSCSTIEIHGGEYYQVAQLLRYWSKDYKLAKDPILPKVVHVKNRK